MVRVWQGSRRTFNWWQTGCLALPVEETTIIDQASTNPTVTRILLRHPLAPSQLTL